MTRICDKNGTCPANFEEQELFGVHSDIGGGYNGKEEVILLRVESSLDTVNKLYGTWRAEMKQKAVSAGCEVLVGRVHAYFFDVRKTRPELALVALNAMHEKAVACGVPLRPLVKSETVPQKLADFVAKSRSGDAAALKQLDEQYIHTSHRKLSLVTITEGIIMAPEKDGVRDVFYNHPDRAVTSGTLSQRRIP